MSRPVESVRSGPGRDRPTQEVADVTLVVRGASRGFTVLLLGGIVQPWVGVIFAPLGYVWLALVAIAAFAWAAWPRDAGRWIGRVDRALIGCVAALCSYLLVLPLVASAAGSLPWSQMIFTSMTAVVTGALAGAFAPLGSTRRADVRRA